MWPASTSSPDAFGNERRNCSSDMSVCSEQLRFSVFMWLEENFTHRFSVCLHKECAGTCWTRTVSSEAARGPPIAGGSNFGETGL